jgi:hypothetical protein
MSDRPPLPPFTLQKARQKVQAAEDAWNTRPRIFGPRPEAERGRELPLRWALTRPAGPRAVTR